MANIKLPAAKEAIAIVLHELLYLAAEAVGMVGAALLIKVMFWALEHIEAQEFPGWAHQIPLYVALSESLVYAVFCGFLHLTRMGKHLRELFASAQERGREAIEEQQAKHDVLGISRTSVGAKAETDSSSKVTVEPDIGARP